MIHLEWLPDAEISRDSAIEYIAKDNLSAALNQLDEIEKQADMLLDHPKMGRPGREKGTRELIINRTPFILIYRINGNMIQVLHFLHGAQQWPPIL